MKNRFIKLDESESGAADANNVARDDQGRHKLSEPEAAEWPPKEPARFNQTLPSATSSAPVEAEWPPKNSAFTGSPAAGVSAATPAPPQADPDWPPRNTGVIV
jgi:hypothetical protein